MATDTLENKRFFEESKHFPQVINGRINAVQFLEAAVELLSVLEQLGKVFAPVKYDMNGNIDKIKKLNFDNNSCLLELLLHESANGKPVATEGVLWLNRALCFFEIAFQEIIQCLRNDNLDVSMKKIFTIAYEGSVKPYHSWATQQIFAFISRLSPSLPQIMKSFGEEKQTEEFILRLSSFNKSLHLVRCSIDNFYKEHNLL